MFTVSFTVSGFFPNFSSGVGRSSGVRTSWPEPLLRYVSTQTGSPQCVEPRACIRWIKGRAYAELGAWARWGGRRQEPLVATGEIVATRDPNTAAILVAQRLAELRRKRAANQTGAPAAASDVPTSVGAFIGYHLAAKADVKGRRKPSPAEIGLQRTRLLHAANFLRTRGIRDLRQIDQISAAQFDRTNRHWHAGQSNIRQHQCPAIGRRAATGCMLVPPTFATLQARTPVKARFSPRG